jgi:hypothetical protein
MVKYKINLNMVIQNVRQMLGFFFFLIFLISCSEKKNSYTGKQYSAVNTLEGNTKQYLEFNFISDSTCIFFQNQYDIESDKLFEYENNKKNYKYYLENKHLVFVNTGERGLDTMRLEKQNDVLIWHFGNVTKGVDGYPQIQLRNY